MNGFNVSTSHTEQNEAENPRLTAALGYANRGWPVFPVYEPGSSGPCSCSAGEACTAPAKHPRTPHGFKDASIDEVTIRPWWSWWPNANIGIATGPSSGLVVVDVDPRHSGDRGLAQLEGEHGRFPATLTCDTGSGGWHLYFAQPEAVVPSTTKLRPGIDIRSNRSYVIAPPSRHANGRPYEWRDTSQAIVAPPNWLLRCLLEDPEVPETATPDEAEQEFYSEGERNDRLFQFSCFLFKQRLSLGAVEEEVLGFNARRCRPPLGEREVRAVVQSAGRYGRGDRQDRPRIHSAAPRDGVAAERILTFRTAAEIARETPPEVRWIARPWVAESTLTEVSGKPKEAGKTTWVMAMVRCMLDGTPFMGEPTSKTAVVYLTEERHTTLRAALKRAGLLERDDLVILQWQNTLGVPWEAVVKAAIAECQRRGATVLVVDTVSQFANLVSDTENNSGDALTAYRPLQKATAAGLGVIPIRHERKSGGNVGEAGRGSNAFTGAADIVLSIGRPEGQTRRTIRLIRAISRLDDTPDELAIELVGPAQYVALGSSAAIALREACDAILKFGPRAREQALDVPELGTQCGLKRTTTQEAIRTLRAEGKLEQTGSGRKNDAYRYWVPVPDDSAGTPIPIAAERIDSAEQGVVQ